LNERRPLLILVLKTTGTYLLFAALWIAFSDDILLRLASTPEQLSHLQTFKGLFFVIITAALLAVLLYRNLSHQQKLQSRYQQLLNQLPVVVYSADPTPERRLRFLSPQALSYWGWDPNMQDVSLTDGIHIDDRAMVSAAIKEALTHQTNVQIEYRFVTPRGETLWLRDATTFITDKDTAETYLDGVLLDITETKLLSQHLQQSHEALESLIQASPLPILNLDLNGHVQRWNRAAEHLFGWSEAEVQGKPNPSVPEHLRYAFRQILEDVRNGVEISGKEMIRQTKTGNALAIRMFPALMRNSEGIPVGIVSILENITDRRQREKELEAITHIAESLRTANNLEEIQSVTLDCATALVQGQAGAIIYQLPAGEGYRTARSHGVWSPLQGLRIQKNDGCLEHCFKQREMCINNELCAHQCLFDGEFLQNLQSIACLPLIAHEQVLATLAIGRNQPVSPMEARILKAIGNIAAAAIHRFHLFEQSQRQIKHLNTLRNIELAITGSQDLHLTLSLLIRNLRAELQVDAVAIHLTGDAKKRFPSIVSEGFRIRAADEKAPINQGLAQIVAKQSSPLFIAELNQSPVATTASNLLAEEGFCSYFALPLVARGELRGVLETVTRASLDPSAEWLEYLEAFALQAAIAIENATLLENLKYAHADLVAAYERTIEGWSKALDLRDKETEGHSLRVTDGTLELARALGLPETEMVHIRHGALLHDIGKVGIPDNILLKPGPLTEDEWQVMQRHPQLAFELLAPIDYLRQALDIPYCHHEKWDGCGYPRGLKGEQIPLAARIFSVIDVWDALGSDRPYRSAWDEERVLNYIETNAGSHFDPVIVNKFLELRRQGKLGQDREEFES